MAESDYVICSVIRGVSRQMTAPGASLLAPVSTTGDIHRLPSPAYCYTCHHSGACKGYDCRGACVDKRDKMGVESVDVTGYNCVHLTHGSNASAKIYLHGAHLASCITAAGNELIFMSQSAASILDRYTLD